MSTTYLIYGKYQLVLVSSWKYYRFSDSHFDFQENCNQASSEKKVKVLKDNGP